MNRKNTGFTLVEILIVVIILGILAAIVIPQFTQASQDARNSALTSDLQTLRSQIELFRVQHLDKYPDAVPNNPATDSATFVALMTTKTNNDGSTTGAPNLGPYLQQFPSNSFVPAAVQQTVTVGNGPVPGDNSSGWYYNKSAASTNYGKISPNDNVTGHSAL